MTGPLVMDSIRKEVAELAKFARQTDVGLKAKAVMESGELIGIVSVMDVLKHFILD